jgi:hypothetical protein
MIQRTNGTGTWMELARTLPPEARIMGVYLLGASRTGKSRMLGRVIAWQDFMDEIGQVIFDPRGVTISNFLDKVVRFLQYVPFDQHDKYWRRIKLVDVSCKSGFVTGLPLYYWLTPEETLAEISERYLQLILRSNPHLADAQYFGWPPLHRFGLNAGIICASLGLQVTDIAKLISHPEQWLSRLTEAEARFPEAKPACDFFRTEYLLMRQADRERLTTAFRDKLVQFTHDELLSYQFGASVPGIDWEEVEAEGLTVLLDFSGETNTELRRFKMLWLFDYLFSWIKIRGRRSFPLALLIDEFASMAQKVFSGENPFAVELTEFIQEYLRNSNILLTVAHQSIEQLDDQLRNTLLSLGTYVFGKAATMEEARVLADVLWKKDPFLVKHYREKWEWEDHHNWVRFGNGSYRETRKQWVLREWEPTAYVSLEEQLELSGHRIFALPVSEFYLRPALSEGTVSSEVMHLTIADIDRDEYPDQRQIAEVRATLAAQPGMPVEAILQEQETRLREPTIRRTPQPAHDGRDGQPARRQPQAGYTRPQRTNAGAEDGRQAGVAVAEPPPAVQEQQHPDQPPARRHQQRRRLA